MRKIEQAMVEAIRSGRNWSSGNTTVQQGSMPVCNVFLHGNHIAECAVLHDETIVTANRETFRRWPTRTTVSRLRALGVDAYVRKGVAMIGDQPA